MANNHFEQLKLENNHEAFPDQFDIYSYEVFHSSKLHSSALSRFYLVVFFFKVCALKARSSSTSLRSSGATVLYFCQNLFTASGVLPFGL